MIDPAICYLKNNHSIIVTINNQIEMIHRRIMTFITGIKTIVEPNDSISSQTRPIMQTNGPNTRVIDTITGEIVTNTVQIGTNLHRIGTITKVIDTITDVNETNKTQISTTTQRIGTTTRVIGTITDVNNTNKTHTGTITQRIDTITRVIVSIQNNQTKSMYKFM